MPYYEIFENKAKSRNLNIITFGKHPDATIHMDDFSNTNPIIVDGKTYTIKGLISPDQICDALAVVGVAKALDLSIEMVLERLSTFQAVRGRGDVHDLKIDGKNIKLINSSYNANPISMKTAIETLVTMAKSRRVAIIADMLELGPNEKDLHRQVGKFLGEKKIEIVITYGELSKLVTEEALKTGVPFSINVRSHEEIISICKAVLADGDTVLVKASNGMGLEKIVDSFIKNSQ